MLDALGPGNIRNMHQPVNAVFDLDECPEVGQVTHAPFDARADRVTLRQRLPRIGFDLLDAETDSPIVRIHFEHLRFDLLADRKQLRWMLDAFRPAHL